MLTLSLVGCGGGSSDETTTDTAPPPITPPVTPTPPTTPPINETNDKPNILFIISDDQGLDSSAQYDYSNDLPITPNLDDLANAGLVFDNVWASPSCTTTRAAIITGKYGINSGVTYTPAVLTDEHELIQTHIQDLNENYQTAVIGKWHLGGGNPSPDHPNQLGLSYYAGNLSNISDYYNWELTVNGENEQSSEYHTTKLTNIAIDWINQQTTPWFTWLAYSAPHSPFHVPPQNLHSRTLSGTDEDINQNTRQYYLSAIEAMDAEIGRLLSSIDSEVLNNTIIIYMGDNGTPRRIIDTSVFERNHAKGTLYQGGISVPFFVSGKGVERIGERENALIAATDIFATIAQIAGSDTTDIYDSTSFIETFTSENFQSNEIIATSFESASTTGVAIRSDDFKVIKFIDNTVEAYDISGNFSETIDLSNEDEFSATINELIDFSVQEGLSESNIINITNVILDNTNANCEAYMAQYMSNANDIARDLLFVGDLQISVENDKCIFSTNAIPNHDFNDGGNRFPNNVSEQSDRYEITVTPQFATDTTPLTLRIDNAIMLNGVKVDLLAAGCFGIANGKTGCNDINTPWRYDPMHLPNGFNVDSHNAHSQADGTYHYHGSPLALFAQDPSKVSPVVGFAADGFPIYGSYIEINGVIRKATSSYRLKQGLRPSDNGQPGGTYDGSFRDDYEYIEGLGDLDECNGLVVNNSYAYYITDGFPYIIGCFKGTVDDSFLK